MKKKKNNQIIKCITKLNDYDKLRLYDFILRIRGSGEINQVYYTAKQPKSQAKRNKK